MKPANIREMTDEELDLSERNHRREVLDLRLQAQTGQNENSARIRLAKKDLARVLTEKNRRASQA